MGVASVAERTATRRRLGTDAQYLGQDQGLR